MICPRTEEVLDVLELHPVEFAIHIAGYLGDGVLQGLFLALASLQCSLQTAGEGRG